MSDWPTVPLSSLADIRVSNVDKKSYAHEKPVRLCNYMDVYSHDYIDGQFDFMEATADQGEIDRFGVKRGDILITKDSETPDDIGIPATVVDDIANLVCGYHLAQIRPDQDRIDPIYLAKQLSRPDIVSYFGRMACGSTRHGLSNRAIAQTPIIVAPIEDQRRIAATLRSIDNAIRDTEVLIAKHQQIKAGLMHDLFDMFGDTAVPLSSVAVVERGKFTARPRNDPQYYDGDFPFIQTGDVAACSGGYLFDAVQSLNNRGLSVSKLFGVGTVMVTIAANIADTCILARAMCSPDSLVGVVPFDLRMSCFIELCIRRCKPRLEAMAPQSAQRNINLTDLRPLMIPWPDEKQRLAISEQLYSWSSHIGTLSNERSKLLKIKQGLMSDLLNQRPVIQA